MPNKITGGNYQVSHADNHKTQNNSKNDAKVKNVTIKNQTPESKKHYKQDKPFDKMSLNKTTPNSYNLVANTSILKKLKNKKIACGPNFKNYNLVAKLPKASNNQQKSIDSLLNAVDKLDEFYNNFDNVSKDTKDLLEESKKLKNKLEEKKNDPSYNKKDEDEYNTNPKTQNLKDEFTTKSNNLFKYHNTQIQFEKKNISKMAVEIKKLDKQIRESISNRESEEKTNNLRTTKKNLHTQYKLYKGIVALFKKLNIHKNTLYNDNNLNKKMKKVKKNEKNEKTEKNKVSDQYKTSDKNLGSAKKTTPLDYVIEEQNLIGKNIANMESLKFKKS